MVGPVSSARPAHAPQPESDAGRYTVQRGDCLWTIAQHLGVALADLIAANPDIANPDVIYPDQDLIVPAGGHGAIGAAGSNNNGGATPVSSTGGIHPGSGSGSDVAALAAKFLDRNASDLKNSGELPMDSWVPNDVCCANFVTAVLQKAGKFNGHSNSVSEMASMLKAQGWKVVSAAEAKPGDVCILNNGGHTELVSSNNGGDITLIGSNNSNADGSQRVSYGSPYGGAWYLSPP